jgi:hypothetical protein
MVQPPPVSLPEFGGAQIPADYAGLLQSPEAFPPPEQQEAPGRGSQALDYTLAALGNLLGGGGIGGALGGILQVKNNIAQIQEENRQAREKAREEKLSFIMQGMEANRKDREGRAKQMLDDAKLEGDRQRISQAESELRVERERLGVDRERMEAADALSQAELERMKGELLRKQNPDREEGLSSLKDYTISLGEINAKLRESFSRGDAIPSITIKDSSGAEITLQGDEIKRYLEDDLEGVVNYFAALGEDPDGSNNLGEAARSSFESSVDEILQQWTMKQAINRREAARKGATEAKTRAYKLQQKEERNARNRAMAGKAARNIGNVVRGRPIERAGGGGGGY